MKVKSDLKRISAGEDSYKVIFGNEGNILSASEKRTVLANQGKALYGTENEAMVKCPACHGKGTVQDEVAGGPVECEPCGGSGKVEKSYADQFKNDAPPDEGELRKYHAEHHSGRFQDCDKCAKKLSGDK